MKKTVFIIIVFFTLTLQAQEKNTKNIKQPIAFVEMLMARSFIINDLPGWAAGGELNYQYKNHLFSFRYIEDVHNKFVIVSPSVILLPLPSLVEHITNKELGILYGRRWIYDDTAISVSGGISYNHYTSKNLDSTLELIDDYLGFPLEVNIKWFKAQKERYRIYQVIPVGKPTAFGRSFGFKFFANINKHSYLGFGFTYGFGWHKKYEK